MPQYGRFRMAKQPVLHSTKVEPRSYVARMYEKTTKLTVTTNSAYQRQTLNSHFMDKSLIVYKASAGSGKTFTLTIEYIKLLIANPLDYNAILGVTFTNKATEEMKTRILSQLYGIWKRLDDSKAYMKAICSDLGVSPDFASRRAGTALQLLLHNYDAFGIETIDSFFQRVLRNLARELDLTANLRVELNDEQVEMRAVDVLIDELSANDELLSWIMSYIKDNIKEDKSWNVIGAIKSFGRNIFRDFYKEAQGTLAAVIEDNSFFDNYRFMLYDERDAATKLMQNYADKYFSILSANGLSVDDISNKANGVSGFFIKLCNGIFDNKPLGKRVIECLGQADAWASKTHPERDRIRFLAGDQLMGLLKDTVTQWNRRKSAEKTLRHLNQLRLLNRIEQKVRELNEEANQFLLCDTQYLLKSLISDSDSPFIYEKIGARLKHIMIDEFQDTSSIQWKNFKVLMADCMSSEGSRNIIVGDVKQSIYRWRDSDWRMLNEIEKQFPRPQDQVETRNLGMNYRSQRNIIEFNNAFFACAAKQECDELTKSDLYGADQLASAYADVRQRVPDGRPNSGSVSIELLSKANYENRTLVAIADKVEYLTTHGISQNEIAILVRSNKYIPLIANYFSECKPGVRIVSDEAFRLDASLAVNMIVNALHLLTHPDDAVSKAFLATAYQRAILGSQCTEYEMVGMGNIDSLLPHPYIAFTDKLLREPLYDLAEHIYYIFDLKKLADQGAYVCAFFDQLSDFTKDISSSIDSFIDFWNENACSKTIQSDKQDGIRLISIHKSKGLEFDNVIVPFCDWQLEKTSGNIIWCKPEKEPYNNLPLVPVDCSSTLLGTIYEKDYMEEHFQNCVDNLNLLYVAFTRASRNLFVVGRRDASNSRSAILQKCLPQLAKSLPTAQLDNPEDKDCDIVFKYGELCKADNAKGKHSVNPFCSPVSIERIGIETYKNKTEFRQSNASMEFTNLPDDGSKRGNYVKRGAILHKVFSCISSFDDIDKAVKQLITDGILSNNAYENKRLKDFLFGCMSDMRVKDWFSDKWKVFNECTILSLDKNGKLRERRPDRVMTDGKQIIVVDFKFGSKRNEHHLQVREYMDLLSAMGHANVKGYLWYVYESIIVEVK